MTGIPREDGTRGAGGARGRMTRGLAWVAFAPALGLLAADGPDKSAYHLFHRTPSDERRSLAPDRPDRTESAYTVDAGWFQLETDFLVWERDTDHPDDPSLESEAWAVLPFNLKAGLLPNLDLQVIMVPYLEVTETTPLTRERRRGSGDLVTRLKWNLWGNDGGTTALAIMPFVKWPISGAGLGNSSVEGGLAIPLAVELPAGFGLGVMTQPRWLADESGGGSEASFVNSITLSREIAWDVSAFVEFFSEVETGGEPWTGTFDFGLTWALGEDLMLDAGAYVGVTRSAPDVIVFSGMTWRF